MRNDWSSHWGDWQTHHAWYCFLRVQQMSTHMSYFVAKVIRLQVRTQVFLFIWQMQLIVKSSFICPVPSNKICQLEVVKFQFLRESTWNLFFFWWVPQNKILDCDFYRQPNGSLCVRKVRAAMVTNIFIHYVRSQIISISVITACYLIKMVWTNCL